mmetsp:Transcript_31764/g.57839  ORF Transcript_31764/g.57839 Transcript_31764/m.57839 type:complete len:209 (-) Transcript_31764:206-832(-)
MMRSPVLMRRNSFSRRTPKASACSKPTSESSGSKEAACPFARPLFALFPWRMIRSWTLLSSGAEGDRDPDPNDDGDRDVGDIGDRLGDRANGDCACDTPVAGVVRGVKEEDAKLSLSGRGRGPGTSNMALFGVSSEVETLAILPDTFRRACTGEASRGLTPARWRREPPGDASLSSALAPRRQELPDTLGDGSRRQELPETLGDGSCS